MELIVGWTVIPKGALPAATKAAGGVFVQDGQSFMLDAVRYEFDTGPVIVTNAAGVEGQTLTIDDDIGRRHIFELDTDGGFDCCRFVVASPGANADLIAGVYILSGARYPQAVLPDAKVD